MQTSIALSEITMNYRSAGAGPLMVLLHGWPQTSLCWRHVMPTLAEHFHVVAPDLRGYGRTDKPVGDYSKRRMAQDIRELVDALGYDELRLVGHDRGARVAHRFALDHSDVLSHVTLLDIMPTVHAFRRGTPETAAGQWHWLFHQRADLPELLVGSNIEAYLRYFFTDWTFQRAKVEEEIPSYVAAFSEPEHSVPDSTTTEQLQSTSSTSTINATTTADTGLSSPSRSFGEIAGKRPATCWRHGSRSRRDEWVRRFLNVVTSSPKNSRRH